MSGVETIIKYETAGTPKVVTNMMGVVMGLPLRVINKQIPIRWSSTGFGTTTYSYELKGDHHLFTGLVKDKAKILGMSIYVDDKLTGSANGQGITSIEVKAAVAGDPGTPAVNATINEANIGTTGSVLTIPQGAIEDWTKVFTVKVSMVILDETINEPKTIYQVSDLVELFGAEAVVNPVSNLAYGAYMYAQGAGNKAFKILPVVPSATGCSVEDLLASAVAWDTACKSFMEISNDTYHFVPLTANTTILNSMAKNAEQYSTPEKKKEFRVYQSAQVTRPSSGVYGTYEDSIDAIMFSDSSSDVFLKGRSAILGTSVYANAPMNFKKLFPGVLTKDTLKENIKKAVANSLYSHRVTNIFPCYFSVENGAVRIPGYMAAARICGERDASALSTSFTLRPYGWISEVPTCEQFKLADFEEMVTWGNHVIVQETESALAKCYGENTCHIELLEKAGENYVVSVDYLARRIRDHLIKYIANGPDNKISSDPKDPATARYLKKINSSLDFIKHELITEKEVFSKIEISSITLGDGITIPRNRIDYVLRVKLYYSVEEINVTIIVV